MDAQKLRDLIKQACDILRNNTIEESVDQLAWLLFIKYSEARESELQKAEMLNYSTDDLMLIPEEYRWSTWTQMMSQSNIDKSTIENKLQQQILPYFKDRFKLDLAYTQPQFVQFKGVFDILQGLNTMPTDRENPDIIAALYGVLLEQLTPRHRKAGVFATPYPVTQFMVKVLNPRDKEHVYDPSCGVGNLLLAAYNHMSPLEDNTQAQIIRGSENCTRIYQLARMNLLLHGINTTYICHMDPLSTQSFSELFENWFIDDIKEIHVILNHPPLGNYLGNIKEKKSLQAYAPEQLTRIDEWFLRYNMGQLKRFPKSRCGMVISERTLAGTEHKTEGKEGAAMLRYRLFRDYTIQMIVWLPPGIFPGSNERTFLLFFSGERAKYQRTLHYDLAKELGITGYSKKRLPRVDDFQRALDTWNQWSQYLESSEESEEPRKTDYQWIECYEGWEDDDREKYYPYSLLTYPQISLPEPRNLKLLVEQLVENSNKLYEMTQRLRLTIYGKEEL